MEYKTEIGVHYGKMHVVCIKMLFPYPDRPLEQPSSCFALSHITQNKSEIRVSCTEPRRILAVVVQIYLNRTLMQAPCMIQHVK